MDGGCSIDLTQSQFQQKITLKMSEMNPANNSINQLLQIFKHYRQDSSRDTLSFNSQFIQTPQEATSTRADNSFLQPFSFSKEKDRKTSYGFYSSLQRVSKSKQKHSNFSTRRSHAQTQSSDSNVFHRLYQENQSLKQKRERLFQEGRRSIETKQNRQCTFSPNAKLRVRAERSFNEQDSESFYQKNMEWQLKKDKQIKLKQCERHSSQKDELTFTPRIHPFRKKCQQNKENSQYTSTKRKTDSYLQNYQKAHRQDKQQGDAFSSTFSRGLLNIKKGYFSYAR